MMTRMNWLRPNGFCSVEHSAPGELIEPLRNLVHCVALSRAPCDAPVGDYHTLDLKEAKALLDELVS
jgi:hypothetical protein